jgi:hypothetical protein
MRGDRQLLRLGEYLLRRACQRLPQDIRQGRYREWAAELPAILTDPQIRPAPRRAVRMLAYAADTVPGADRRPVADARHQTLKTASSAPPRGWPTKPWRWSRQRSTCPRGLSS